MNATSDRRFRDLSIIEWYRMPLRERVADRLADLMFNADDLLDMLKAEDKRREFISIEPDLRQIYNTVNMLMKSLCD